MFVLVNEKENATVSPRVLSSLSLNFTLSVDPMY